MAKLIIKRKSEWSNRLKAYKLFIDGKQVESIKNGEIKEFQLEDGTHQVEAKVNWCSTGVFEFEVIDGKTKMYEVSLFKYGNIIGPLMGLLAVILIIGRRYAEANEIELGNMKYIAILVIPFFLYMIYYITLGRKKYLRIKSI
ncbi:hypothetical protein EMN47_16905 [Prolixibacteraceae bacterium JC049]|nr:hypothetical protein [Prolixibacteraceae bacterium JC049]